MISPMHPHGSTDERTYELLSKLSGVKESGDGKWTALCPAHDDNKNSLSITISESEQLLLYCHAGCTTHSILNAVGLSISHLFPAPPSSSSSSPRRRGRNPGRQ